jgi:hypothetical protein
MASSFPENNQFVNYREFEDFRQESRDAFDNLIISLDEKFTLLGDNIEGLKSEIQSLQIDQLKFQLQQTEKKMVEEKTDNEGDRNYRRALTVAVIAAMIGPMVGAILGLALGFMIP